MKLLKHLIITGILKCETGLHIGGEREELEVGGVDLPVIKHPITKEPYIPGSSLKGKMRSELEKKYGKVQAESGEPCGCAREDCFVCRLFGPHKNTDHNLGPTRMLVRDSFFTSQTRNEFERIVKEKGMEYLEKKTENIIDRRTGRALHPRTQERVPAGAEFNIEIILQIFEGDDEQLLLDKVKEGLKLIQASYLGGSGSRGYGKVKFYDLRINGTPLPF